MVISTPIIGLGLCSLALGIALGTLLSPVQTWVFIGVVLSGGLFIIATRKKGRVSSLLLISILLLLFGMVRASLTQPVRTTEADRYLNTSIMMTGTISSDPDRRASTVQYVLRPDQISGSPVEAIHILAILPRYPEYRVGDSLTLSGTLTLPEDFDTDPSRPPFPYIKYLAKDGIGYIIQSPRVLGVEASTHFSILRTLSGWKRAILEKGHTLFPEPEGGLLAGMILGERHALPKDILDQMRIAGLVHIIVVSGYNMTVVAEMVSRMFRFLPLLFRSGVGLCVVWIYAGMVGGGAPVIRAAIMTSFALLSRMTGNTALALRLLYLSGIIMTLQNPRIVLDDASFHLSFLATLGLIVLSSKMTEIFSQKRNPSDKKKEKKLPWWKELFVSTLSAQLMVFPYILFFSGQLSPYALPANLLALPLVPIAMGLGSIAILVGAVFPWGGSILGALAALPASWVLGVGKWFATLPGSGAVIPFPLWGSLLLYLFGFLFLRRFWKRDTVDISEK